MKMKESLGFIEVSDGTTLKFKISIIDIKEAGFSPFGGINFDVKVIGGIATHKVPEDLKKAVADKPVMPLEIPHDGWEILKIKEQKPAIVEEVVDTSKGKYTVRVIGEIVMVAHNMKYRSPLSEPVYWASWVYKISWEPQESGGI
jgi:hypothetical protein